MNVSDVKASCTDKQKTMDKENQYEIEMLMIWNKQNKAMDKQNQ